MVQHDQNLDELVDRSGARNIDIDLKPELDIDFGLLEKNKLDLKLNKVYSNTQKKMVKS